MGRCCMLMLLDGLGDRAHGELDGKTPLQAASTPHFDRLAANGSNGLLWAIRPGLSLPSENAHFALFGYEQHEFPGRGYLEAAGAGVALQPDDVALLAHFVNVLPQQDILQLVEHRPRSTAYEASQLGCLIGNYGWEGGDIRFHPTHGLDGIVTIRGKVSREITDSDPLQIENPLLAVQPWRSFAENPIALKTAHALNSYLLWCHKKLANHSVNVLRRKDGKVEINGLVTQRAGKWRQVEPFAERWGVRGLSISSGLMYQGLASFLGMDSIKVADSDDPGEDLAQRLLMAKKCSPDYGFIHVHTKTPDVAGHSKDPHNKVTVIESLDQGVGKVMEEICCDEIVLVVTADHSTASCGPLVHSGESVPFVVSGQGIRRDRVSCFDEVSCAAGCMGTLRGSDFMYLVLNWLDKSKLQGLMDTPVNQPFWPGERRFLRI